jgi:MaoC dehydratase-like protein
MSTTTLYLKAAAGLLPFLGPSGDDIPDRRLALDSVEIDRERLAKYARVCGFRLRDELPPTYIHILAFPLHLELMTDSSMPFGAVGLVHIANRIVQHRPVRMTERLALSVHGTPLEDHPKGRQFTLVTEARVGDELVWEGFSTNLKRGEGAGEREERSEPELQREAEWRVPGDIGRRYADVSGDRNPIHMHDLSAKLFGFPRAIAHGMWTKARCLAALEGRLPRSFEVDVRFGKPLLLPATVEFCTNQSLDFAVRGKGVHLTGGIAERS